MTAPRGQRQQTTLHVEMMHKKRKASSTDEVTMSGLGNRAGRQMTVCMSLKSRAKRRLEAGGVGVIEDGGQRCQAFLGENVHRGDAHQDETPRLAALPVG
jgi:hypothetical protein